MASDDEEMIVLEGREWTVSLSEKVSTGDYENFNPHVSLSGDIPAPESELDPATRTQVKRELTAVADSLQRVLDTTIDRRLQTNDPEDWPGEGDSK